MPSPPATSARPSGWSLGRITALVIGALLVLVSIGLLGVGGTGLWADLTQRDPAGYVTTDVHAFSTSGSALVTDRVELDSPGVGWLYSSAVLGEVRIRVTPVGSDSPVFVGIGPSNDVDRYLAGVDHTLISEFWGNEVQTIEGGATASAPGTQEFWVASATGPGAQTLTWDPANGSWTVVVMNADGRREIGVGADLGATYPALLGIAIGSLVAGGIFLIGGALLIGGAIRRSRAPNGPGSGEVMTRTRDTVTSRDPRREEERR
ncbi:MAG TPA: hypothetical protein VFI59_06615 [Actinomycetota bacterium]|nr:hypothetical protein [Actinomycetota bacterium]